MPTQEFFDRHPPFPTDLPVFPLPELSYSKLLEDNPEESSRLWDVSVEHGFFLLDLSDGPGGVQLLEDIAKVFEIGKSFFDQPLSTKKEFKVNSGNVGYKPLGVMKHTDGTRDLTEICAVSRDSILNTTTATIPDVFARERAFLSTIIERLHPIGNVLLQHYARHLDISMEDFDRYHAIDKDSATVLRFIHNPPQLDDKVLQTSLLGHTDSGSITILFAAMGGLQILPADVEDKPENWRWIQPKPNYAIINVGDPLVQWSGGLLQSSYHRVLYAPGAQSTAERYSFGYFLKPADEAPMNRLQKGGVIPRLTIDEIEADRSMEIYDLWHRNKTKGIMKGENSANRGKSKIKPQMITSRVAGQVAAN